ncbi:MAG: DUF2911 domain-containing protein [Acidobacteria bacterium]|nr:DUF2911 domain-containing protein [Acidobacteriota bacterium]
MRIASSRRFQLALFAAALTLLPLMTAPSAEAQDLHPSRRPSPMGMARTFLGDTYVRVVYSRPYLRGRDNIFGTEESGALVPFGKVWRTGANEGTEITVTGDVKVGDQKLPAGTYTIFTVPGADQWTVHFNSKLGFNGTALRNRETGQLEPGFDTANDVVTYTAKPTTLEEPVDQFTISFEDVEGGVHMILRWNKTEVRVPISAA